MAGDGFLAFQIPEYIRLIDPRAGTDPSARSADLVQPSACGRRPANVNCQRRARGRGR